MYHLEGAERDNEDPCAGRVDGVNVGLQRSHVVPSRQSGEVAQQNQVGVGPLLKHLPEGGGAPSARPEERG